MTADAWVVAAVLGGVMVVLATRPYATSSVMGGGLVVLLVSGAVPDATVLSGLASPATATVAALYVVAGAITSTGAIRPMLDLLVGPNRGRRAGLARVVVPTAGASAFVPNTPLVAVAAPRVVELSRSRAGHPSRLLMPLSFAGVLGGVVTVLGTSTNLVVSDLLEAAGDDALGVFEITPVGAIVAAVGLVVLVVSAPVLLPDRRSAVEDDASTGRSFEAQYLVDAGGPVDGRTVAVAGLRDLDGAFLAAIDRAGSTIPARPDARLVGGDRLYFVGDATRIVELGDRPGLTSAEHPHVAEAGGADVGWYEAVVAPRSELAGGTLKSNDFRRRYSAAVVAIHRSGGDVRGALGATDLAAGDVLLVMAGADFARRWRDHGDFSLVAPLSDAPVPDRPGGPIALAAFVGMVVLAAAGVLSLLAAALAAAVTVVIARVLGPGEARRSVDLDVVATIAASIGLGNATIESGLAAELGARLVDVVGDLPRFWMLLVVIVITQLATEVMSNAGAASVMVPVATTAATAVGADPRDAAIAVLIGASCSFLTPVGYQTNLMVYRLGGYRFGDFARLGAPLTATSAVVAAALLS